MHLQTSARAIRGGLKRLPQPSLTSAFRDHIKALKPGTKTTTADHKAWVADNIGLLGAVGQTQHTAEASCRCASQRLIIEGWLRRIGERNVYIRTGKRTATCSLLKRKAWR
jgi:hypothetical protein